MVNALLLSRHFTEVVAACGLWVRCVFPSRAPVSGLPNLSLEKQIPQQHICFICCFGRQPGRANLLSLAKPACMSPNVLGASAFCSGELLSQRSFTAEFWRLNAKEDFKGSHRESLLTQSCTRTLCGQGVFYFHPQSHAKQLWRTACVFSRIVRAPGGSGWLSPLLLHNGDFDKRQQEDGKILHGGTKNRLLSVLHCGFSSVTELR